MKEVSYKKIHKVKNLNHPLGLTLSTPSLVFMLSLVSLLNSALKSLYFILKKTKDQEAEDNGGQAYGHQDK